MSEEDEKIHAKSDSEEDDYENFFLQPATSPYNIAEKLEEANNALFNNSDACENSDREQRVKFSQTLVDYEPDLTDDDVQSIESYNEIADFSLAENPTEELKYVIQVTDKEIYDILEEVEDNEPEDIAEEIEVIEIDDDVSIDEVQSISEEKIDVVEKPMRPKSARKKSPQPTRRTRFNIHIDCKNHCIEELESRLDMCIEKLYYNSENPPCPPLKLHRRKCCENPRVEPKLPLYTGLRSEYGLSASQIQRVEKRKEAIRRKEQKRLELQEAYRKRKIEQNELIFCQWLKDISIRNESSKTGKKCRSPSSVNIISTRPKTATAFNNTVMVKRRQRPHTTATCVFIEVPQRILKSGIRIGDLLAKFFSFRLL